MKAEAARDLGFARVDLDRVRRCGRPEAIFCQGKLPAEVCGYRGGVAGERPSRCLRRGRRPRISKRFAGDCQRRCFTRELDASRSARRRQMQGPWSVGVICAGTADLPVARKPLSLSSCFGRRVERIVDVGVAGLHRVLAETDRIRSCGVLIVAAGMEGALPGVVSGLVDKPLIAVPTSVGYGASFGGLAALLGMLNCCGSGVTVVNIDNGFGAACAADDILRLASS